MLGSPDFPYRDVPIRFPTLRFLLRRLGCYLAAVAVAYLLATLTATQAVVHRLAGMGIDVGLRDRLAMTVHDLAGMAGMFLPMVAFALLVAFMAAALLGRWLRHFRAPLYAVAGGAALVAIHLTLHLTFGLTPIAIARSGTGLFIQGLAGAAGGLVYLALLRRRPGFASPHDLM